MSSITLEQLAFVDAKMLFKALEMRLASAGVIKKRSSKKSNDDASSVSSAPRSIGEGTRKWNDLTKTMASLVKDVLAGEKGGAGFHLKALSYLKNEQNLPADTVPTLEQVAKAVTFLKENPDWESPNKKKPSTASVAKKAEKEAMKAEKEAMKVEKEAKKLKKAEKAEKAEKTVKTVTETTKKASKKMPMKEEPDVSEDESELVEIELEGVSYYWNSESGAVLENIDGHPGVRIGSWSGEGGEITKI